MTTTDAPPPPPATGIPPAGRPPSRRRRPGPLISFVATRIGQSLVTLAILLPAVFLLFRLAPGDAVDAVVGPDVDPAVADQLRARYGLDEPIGTQFLLWLGGLVRGDLGVSFQYQQPVTEVIGERLVNSLALALPSLLLAVVIGILLGALAGALGGVVDRIVLFGGYVLKASPAFWVATLLVLLLSYQLAWFPSIGMGDAAGGEGITRFLTPDFLHHLFLPMVIMTALILVEPMLTTRSGVRDIRSSDFMFLARAQGASPGSVVVRHGVKNAMLPVVSLAPLMVEILVGGQIILETVFSWPGMGRAVVTAVLNADYPVMQAVFLITAVAVVVTNMVVDVVYAYLDPRVRLA